MLPTVQNNPCFGTSDTKVCGLVFRQNDGKKHFAVKCDTILNEGLNTKLYSQRSFFVSNIF